MNLCTLFYLVRLTTSTMTPRKMSAFTRGGNAAGNAGASTNGRWQTATSQDPKSQEQDDIYGVSDKEDDDPPVKIATPKKAPAQVDQFSDPAESPEEFRMEHVKEQGITGFMVKLSVSQVSRVPSRLLLQG